MALLPLVEMGTAPPIAPGYDMLRPMNRFTRRRVELDNCSCPIAEHSRAMTLIKLSCACKPTDTDRVGAGERERVREQKKGTEKTARTTHLIILRKTMKLINVPSSNTHTYTHTNNTTDPPVTLSLRLPHLVQAK